MAHIRQILANLSISVAEFKKNPKTVIKAVKSEPIAVIVNDRPAFYCVPADILESLYSKFYEMNEIQNIQDFASNDGCVGNVNDDDESFGIHLRDHPPQLVDLILGHNRDQYLSFRLSVRA